MVGYAHDFKVFDARVPYEIQKVGAVKEGWGSETLAIVEKTNGRIVKKWERNYRGHGTDAFYPFKRKGVWYAFASPSYTTAEIIDLRTGETVAKMEGKGGFSWCPVNFYVPAYYQNIEKVSFNLKDRGRGDKNYYIATCDYEFNDTHEDPQPEGFDERFLNYLDIAFVGGVFWAADYEWLVYRLDIPSILASGVIPQPESDKYCFEFNYGASPEIRQYVRLMEPESGETEHGDELRMEFYTQKFTRGPNWFAPEEKEVSPVVTVLSKPTPKFWQRWFGKAA